MSKFGSMARRASWLPVGIAYGLGKVAKIGWDEFNEGQKVSAAQTNAVLKSTGGVANVTGEQVRKLADKIMRYSGIDDEAVASGENLLLTFKNIRNEVGKGNDIFSIRRRRSWRTCRWRWGRTRPRQRCSWGKRCRIPSVGLPRFGVWA